MPPLMTPALHRFFQLISASQDWAMMLGGAAEPTPLNQWCMMGLGSRQAASLQGDLLIWNGKPERLADPVALFAHFEALRGQAKIWPDDKQAVGLPMYGGLFGAFGYGFYRWCDGGWQSMPPSADWPDAVLCEFEDWLFIHLESGHLFVLSESLEREAMYYQTWLRIREGADEQSLPGEPSPEGYRQSFMASMTETHFEDTVERLKQSIRQGEVYQANLSLQLKKRMRLDPAVLFERLCRRNPSPFAGLFKWPGGVIVSNSPERLVQADETRILRTRPIAGTRGRGQNEGEDRRIGQILFENEKERAEHLMLVDLARNDLGRVSVSGSVQVDELLTLERYSHVTHLVSNVRGQLKAVATPWDVLAALFPGGTITGCPKLRCIEILDRVEPVPRGFYTGSFGYIDAQTGALDLNILIRSVFLQPTDVPLVYNTAVHVGAGIVHDAVGAHEYRECLRKATAILDELYALEQSLSEPIKRGNL